MNQKNRSQVSYQNGYNLSSNSSPDRNKHYYSPPYKTSEDGITLSKPNRNAIYKNNPESEYSLSTYRTNKNHDIVGHYGKPINLYLLHKNTHHNNESLTDNLHLSKLSLRDKDSNFSNSEPSISTNKASCGLSNIGNTCFMNCILQCLCNTKSLLNYCQNGDYTRELNRSSQMKGALFKSFAQLLQSMWSSPSAISPSDFKQKIAKFAPRFLGYAQQDAQEFMRYLLEGLHVEVNKVQSHPRLSIIDDAKTDNMSEREKAKYFYKRYKCIDDSIISDIFMGQLKSTVVCQKCKRLECCFDPFFDLSLPINRQSKSLGDCLSDFFEEEFLEGEERPKCDKCGCKQVSTKKFHIQHFPLIFVFHLKRFSGQRSRAKLSNFIDFPIKSLNLTPYASTTCENKANAKYRLYAVSNHSGTLYSGHYTAKARHPFGNGAWFNYDDGLVSPTSQSSLVSDKAYILFYERIN